MNEKLTELVFIVDRSGSMCGLESDTIGGFNATLDSNRKVKGDAVVSTVLFNGETSVLHDRCPIGEVPNLTEDDYVPRGNTALLDALGGAIRHIAMVQRYMPESHKPGKTIVVIITDGLENASCEYSLKQVNAMVKEREKAGWEFLFLGANMDAVEEAGRLGIAHDRAATYMADKAGSALAYEAVAQATRSIRGAATGAPRMDSSWKHTVEKDTQKRARPRRRS